MHANWSASSGTHGKSTTTVMTAEALAAAGRDPTALVGARVAGWKGNLRAGGDRLYVLEADEYDRSFLAMSPTVAVVTNVEADHLDVYADLADIRRAFAQFIHGARTIVLCGDDTGASTLPTPSSAEVIRYGIESPDARLRALDVRAGSALGGSAAWGVGAAFAVEYDDELLGEVALRVAGRHNVLNALAAIGAGLALGAPLRGPRAWPRQLQRRRAPLRARRRSAWRHDHRRLRAPPHGDHARRSPRRGRAFRAGASSSRSSRISSRGHATSPATSRGALRTE